MNTILRRRTNWKRRWLSVGVSVACAGLLASTGSTHSHNPLWVDLAPLVLALVVLLLGIYEFVRPDSRKP
jgi:CHASE2 domain-containing sensor protein